MVGSNGSEQADGILVSSTLYARADDNAGRGLQNQAEKVNTRDGCLSEKTGMNRGDAMAVSKSVG